MIATSHSSDKIKPEKVILAGGTGQIGQVLEKEYLNRGYELLVLTRKPKKTHHIYWDGEQLGSWCEKLEGSYFLVNLSGHSILSKDRRKMYDSRINSTKILGTAIKKLVSPPKVWFQMSTTGIYAHRMEGFDDEFEGKLDQGKSSNFWSFIAKLIQDWERTFSFASTPHTRKIILRMSFFMSAGQKGVFKICSRLSRRGLGGSIAGGEQFISWIHERDFINGIDFILNNSALQSPVNFSSPQPISQKDFMRILRKQWGVPFGLPVGKSLLKIGSFFTGIDPDLILKSSRIYPSRLLNYGFEFQYPQWEQASRELVKRHRRL